MSRHTQRRSPAPVLWALIAVLGLPALAQAQVFPNATIHRKRVPCCEEAPVYKMYREQFYGHYPTCWRRWPSGWGCPTPEAPPPWDIVQREAPIRSERDVQVPSLDTSLPALGGLPGDDLQLPDQGSPFEMPGERGQPARSPLDLDTPAPPPARPERSPFDLDTPAPPPARPERSPFDLDPQSALPAPGRFDTGTLLPELAPPDGADVSAGFVPDSFGPMLPTIPEPMPPQTGSYGSVDYPGEVPGPAGMVDAPSQRAPRRGVVASMVDRLKTRLR